MIDFAEIFRQDRPLLDVRAPVEFAQGAFPTATNLPLLDDEQRHEVGICYKEQGSDAAEALGHKLVGPMRDERITGWTDFIKQNPNALLYCFRGGQRSQITASWLKEAGIDIHRIDGGYKAMRQYLLSIFKDLPPITLISGKTGVGKTDLLLRYDNGVDLEGIANHRGSAFGKTRTQQPAQIDFENQLAIQILKQPGGIALEDESRLIGRVSLPIPLQEAMREAPILLLKDSIDNRVTRILRQYVVEQLEEIKAPDPVSVLESEFLESLSAIQKRLGGDRYQLVSNLMKGAFDDHRKGDSNGHRIWIETLLTQYYDPMYEYQLERKAGRIMRTVDWETISEERLLNLGSDPG